MRYWSLNAFLWLMAWVLVAGMLTGCSDKSSDNESKFLPLPEKKSPDPQVDEDTLSRRVEAVLNEGISSQEGLTLAKNPC
jgi:hypothetical protein